MGLTTYRFSRWIAKREFVVKVTGDWIVHNITLQPIQYSLREVRIYSGEDPAYAIMRKAIARAPYHLRQVENYEAEVYLKGSLNMKKIPRILQKNMEKMARKLNRAKHTLPNRLISFVFRPPILCTSG
jgi:hypothetical protein